MMKKKFLEKNIQLYGANFKQWPREISADDIEQMEYAVKHDPYLANLVEREAKFNQLLEILPTPKPSAKLATSIGQAAIAADKGNLSDRRPGTKFLYSFSLTQWMQRKLGSLAMIPASFVIVLGCGWFLGQYYQQPTFEITDFYTDPAVSMIFEE